jgi:hypothetical protein
MFVLQKVDSIDGRLPALDDALVSTYVYRHYRFVAEENGLLLWQRHDQDAFLDERTLLGESATKFDTSVGVPDRGESPIWVEIVVQESLLGKLRAFFYKPPQLSISTTDAAGGARTYRMVRSLAEAGFLASPFLTDNGSIKQVLAGETPSRLKSFSIKVGRSDATFFRPEIQIRFFALRPLTGILAARTQAEAEKFRPFNRVPSATNSPYPISRMREGEEDVIFAHPPSRIEFKVSPPASRLVGHFGLVAKSYAPPNATDGAEFIVEWTSAGGEVTTLFRRVLQPVTVPSDRGTQAFDVALPAGDGVVALRTTPGPSGNVAFDWTYWGELKFVP